MAGQQDQPTLPETTESPGQATRQSLPDRAAQEQAAAPERLAGSEPRHIDHRPRNPITEDLRQRLWRLPPGHPSSPYDGNGALRPPVPALRAMELPLPGEEGYKESRLGSPDRPQVPEREEQRTLENEQTDGLRAWEHDRESTGETPSPWRSAVPHLLGMWQRHQEKWPDSERPPVDRSQDEPGSWRGDSGRYLDREDNGRVDEFYEQIASNEADITARMEHVEKVSTGELIGKEHRLKGRERFKDKVAADRESAPGADLDRVVASIRDIVRYTLRYDDDQYTNGVLADVNRMKEDGLELIKLKNFWGDGEYKGVNSQWRDPDSGQNFEVQFHTESSFEGKQITHGAYERLRSVREAGNEQDRQQVKELHDYQRSVCEKIPMPKNSLEIESDPRRK